jgi:imidazole glycerol-phosphate synthase subunit HisH
MKNNSDNRIAVVNYGAGNLGSVTNALSKLGFKYAVTSDPAEVARASIIVFPGVGAAGDCMQKLNDTGMSKAVSEAFAAHKPVFAICVGLQVLLSDAEEGGGCNCLNLIPGTVRKLPAGLKIPHMGWNQVKQLRKHWIFDGIADNSNFYFVHSYYADPEDKSVVAGTTEYGTTFCSMLMKDNLVATQFHPEKSGEIGLRMYSNFLKKYL